jgi:hypothetical protein
MSEKMDSKKLQDLCVFPYKNPCGKTSKHMCFDSLVIQILLAFYSTSQKEFCKKHISMHVSKVDFFFIKIVFFNRKN